MDDFLTFVVERYNYWTALILLLIGLYAMISKNNLIKKVVGMSIFQTAIILFFVSIGIKRGSTIPILEHHGDHGTDTGAHGSEAVEHVTEAVQHAADAVSHGIDQAAYANPLPHVLMLTAIVVGVGTLGVSLAVIQKVYREHGTIEEDEILESIKE